MSNKRFILLAVLAPALFAGNVMASDSVKIDTTPSSAPDFGGFNQQMEKQIQNIMGGFFNEPAVNAQPLGSVDSAYPKADVIDNKDDVEVAIDLPGVKKDSVEVLVYEDNVTLKVTQSVEKTEQNDKGYYISERQNGSFQRIIQLPADVDFENAQSEYKDGVLRIKIPKLKDQKTKFKKLSF